MTQVALLARDVADREPWLHARGWDRVFVTGGALLVTVPIGLFYALRRGGVSVAAAEDIVTLVVMVLVGGPHVFATYTRTFLEPGFARRERALFLGALAVLAIVVGAAVSSAFLQATIAGRPPMQLVLTFFFFWAGIHIVHQASYCAACYEVKKHGGARPDRARRLGNAVDYLLMLACLYPASFFRMSMIPSGTGAAGANPDALATRIVTELSGSAAFADDYVFRIGRVMPVLPEFVRSEAFWIGVTAVYLTALVAFLVKSMRQARAGTLNRPRFTLVAATTAVGTVVPLFPNLDSAFQGFNAWHSFQYLGLVWLMNRVSYDQGGIRSRLVRPLAAPGAARRFYATAFGATLAMVGVLFLAGWAIQEASGGRFLLFGHDTPPVDPVTGRPEYRPGSLLLAYYMCAFSLLLIHYLHDGVFFFRTRYVVGNAGAR